MSSIPTYPLQNLLLLLVGLTIGSHVPITASAREVNIPVPTRQLNWGEVNIISTSDTHGWLLGHQHATWPEPNYSGDWGSFASFTEHMRAIAASKSVDLLLVDAGDHHDGSGLVSASFQGSLEADDIFGMVPYDILTVGNHELYHYPDALAVHQAKDKWKGRYLTSNVNITVEENGNPVDKVMGDRYAKFKTKQGKKVTAFGVLFDFKAHDSNITVQSPTALSEESWFLEAITEAPDFFLLVGHMPARGATAEWIPIFSAIRARHPRVPVYVFGGHTHVRDCVQYDERSIAVVPGRYLETVAFTSSTDLGEDKPLSVARRYLDANPQTYKFHTNSSDDDFTTTLGLNITTSLLRLSSKLNISTPLGKVPHDLFLSRYPYGHPRSVVTEFAEKVLPSTLFDEERKDKARVVIGNAGSLRFDVGGLTGTTSLRYHPSFLYTQLPANLARNITTQMNLAGPSKFLPPSFPSFSLFDSDVKSRAVHDDALVSRVFEKWRLDMWEKYVERELILGRNAWSTFDHRIVSGRNGEIIWDQEGVKEPVTLGYVTDDACPDVGDDIPHIPVPISDQQVAFIETPFPAVGDEEEVDVVVMDFAMDDFLTAVSVLDPERQLSAKDFKPYAAGTRINTLFSKYAAMAWK